MQYPHLLLRLTLGSNLHSKLGKTTNRYWSAWRLITISVCILRSQINIEPVEGTRTKFVSIDWRSSLLLLYTSLPCPQVTSRGSSMHGISPATPRAHPWSFCSGKKPKCRQLLTKRTISEINLSLMSFISLQADMPRLAMSASLGRGQAVGWFISMLLLYIAILTMIKRNHHTLNICCLWASILRTSSHLILTTTVWNIYFHSYFMDKKAQGS